MEEIEVNIKLSAENQVYYISIRKLDKILKLKEHCKIISNIPIDQQNLFYKGKMLINEKLISDYNIENNHDILLVKKGDPIPENVILNQPFNKFNIKFQNDKEININETANILNKLNLDSFINNIDWNNIDSISQSFGIDKITDISGVKPQKIKEKLNDPSFREIFNKVIKDPSLLKMAFNNPVLQEKIKNFPSLNFGLQNLHVLLYPQFFQMAKNILPKQKENSIENYGTNPPNPFESLDNNQINKMMDSSDQISNINNLNFNNTGNKENLGSNEINLDYKEKFKEQLSQLKNMGFINEETNIQVLKQSNGIIDDDALDNLLKEVK